MQRRMDFLVRIATERDAQPFRLQPGAPQTERQQQRTQARSRQGRKGPAPAEQERRQRAAGAGQHRRADSTESVEQEHGPPGAGTRPEEVQGIEAMALGRPEPIHAGHEHAGSRKRSTHDGADENDRPGPGRDAPGLDRQKDRHRYRQREGQRLPTECRPQVRRHLAPLQSPAQNPAQPDPQQRQREHQENVVVGQDHGQQACERDLQSHHAEGDQRQADREHPEGLPIWDNGGHAT